MSGGKQVAHDAITIEGAGIADERWEEEDEEEETVTQVPFSLTLFLYSEIRAQGSFSYKF